MPGTRRLLVPLLLLAFQFAQAALLAHGYDLAAHADGDETCEVCLHAAHGGQAVPPTLSAPAPPTTETVAPLLPPNRFTSVTHSPYAARAPPPPHPTPQG